MSAFELISSRRAFLNSFVKLTATSLLAAPAGGCASFMNDMLPTPDASFDLSNDIIRAAPPLDKTVVFHIAAGTLTDTKGRFITHVKSGYGADQNNPASTGKARLGPLPVGWWHIGAPHYSDGLVREVMNLDEMNDPVTGRPTDPLNRSLFRIHEVFKNNPNYQDESGTIGCIGVSAAAMKTLTQWQRSGHLARVQVVPT